MVAVLEADMMAAEDAPRGLRAAIAALAVFLVTLPVSASTVAAEALSPPSKSPWDLAMEWGPTVIQLVLIAMLAYHFWQRNLLKALACAAAAVFTFILGW